MIDLIVNLDNGDDWLTWYENMKDIILWLDSEMESK
jgi:hypothetical protein